MAQPSNPRRPGKTVRAARVVRAEDRAVVYELQFPWAKFDNATVKPGQRIAWDIVANNSTVSPSDQQMSLSPTGVTDPWDNPHRWIRAVLDPKPAP